MPPRARPIAAALLAAVAATVLAPAADARFRPHRHRHAARRHHSTARAPQPRAVPVPFGLAPVLPSPATVAPLLPLAPPATSSPPPVTAQALGATVNETPLYTMLLTRVSLRAGSVVLELRNAGQDPHDLVVARSDGTGDPVVLPVTPPGATTRRTLTLAPGSYRLYCALTAPASHDLLGMHAGLTVTG